MQFLNLIHPILLLLSLLTALLAASPSVWSEEPTPVKVKTPDLLVVKIHADWCPACRNVTPTFEVVRKAYKGKKGLRFVVFDVTDRRKAESSAKEAKKLGLSTWFGRNKSKTSTIAIIEAGGPVIRSFYNERREKTYVDALEQALKGKPTPTTAQDTNKK